MDVERKHPRDSMLGEEKIGRLLVKLSIPSMVGMIVHALYNFVDAIFIGRGVGVDAIGGLAVAFPFQILIMSMAGAIGVGASSVVSRNLGAGNRERAYQSAGNAIMMSFFLGIGITVLGLVFLDQLLRLFGATDVLIGFSRDYLSIILLGSVLGVTGMTTNNIVRAEGQALIAMVTMLVGTLLNLILDPIFIFVLKLGIKGAAYATVISQCASAAFLLGYFISGRSSLELQLHHLKLKADIVKEMLTVGFPSFVRQAGGSMMMVVINNTLGAYGGDIYISLMGVINRFFMLIFMVIFGIVQGLQPIVGYNYGAGKFDRVRAVLRLSVLSSTMICLVAFSVLMIFPGELVSIFNEDRELISIGVVSVRLVILAIPLVGFQIIASSFFQALGKARPALILGMSRQFFFLLPAVIILPVFFGVNGVWISFPVADLLAVILTIFWYIKEIQAMKPQGIISDQVYRSNNT